MAPLALPGMPSIAIDDDNNIFAVWSGATMATDPDNYLLRHLYGRGYSAASGTWGDITDLTDDFLYSWSECVYPSLSPTTSEGKVHLLFQEDELAGIYLNGNQGAQGQGSTSDNDMVFLDRSKYVYFGVVTGEDELQGTRAFRVSQNYPNPAEGHTSVAVNLPRAGNLSLRVSNTAGQTICSIAKGNVQAGLHNFAIDCSNWSPGVYFYTVTSGNDGITNKMIVR